MKKPDTIVADIHKIRRQIEAETKGMTSAQISAFFNATGERLAKQYGFKRVTVDEVRVYTRNLEQASAAYTGPRGNSMTAEASAEASAVEKLLGSADFPPEYDDPDFDPDYALAREADYRARG